MYYHMEHWFVACIGLLHWHALTSNPSLREQLDSVVLSGQWVGN